MFPMTVFSELLLGFDFMLFSLKHVVQRTLRKIIRTDGTNNEEARAVLSKSVFYKSSLRLRIRDHLTLPSI
jgi:hypothetical protein